MGFTHALTPAIISPRQCECRLSLMDLLLVVISVVLTAAATLAIDKWGNLLSRRPHWTITRMPNNDFKVERTRRTTAYEVRFGGGANGGSTMDGNGFEYLAPLSVEVGGSDFQKGESAIVRHPEFEYMWLHWIDNGRLRSKVTLFPDTKVTPVPTAEGYVPTVITARPKQRR